MERELKHIFSVNNRTQVFAVGEVDPVTNACYRYEIRATDDLFNKNPTIIELKNTNTVKEPKGCFTEDLLAIVDDILSNYQESRFNCVENDNALRHIKEARLWLYYDRVS